jgi:hypothetical protein
MRSIRNSAPNFNVSVNLVSPWIVNTTWLTQPLRELVEKHGIPVTDMNNVARGVAHIATSDWNGQSLYVAGERFIELEGGIDRSRKDWLGAEFDELASRNKNYAHQMRGQSGW